MFWLLRKVIITKTTSWILTIGLAVSFVLLYFVNVEIAKCINLEQGWDIGIVNGMAWYMSLGEMIKDHSYFALYPNNVPIAYFLWRLYEYAKTIPGYTYSCEFFWVMVICGMISVIGFMLCMTVKRITQKPAVVLLTFFLYVACVCVTPWKTAAYTDMFAMPFPILCLCLYVLFCSVQNKWIKYVLWFLIMVCGFFGALIKPPVLIAVIAVFVLEFIKSIAWNKKSLADLGIKIALLILTVILYQGYKQYIYDVTEFVYNENAAVTYHHYLLMGINEERTGSYCSDVLAFHGRFLNPEERIPAQWEAYFLQLKERGILRHMQFLLKKMVMTFNDGAFGWGREGAFEYFSYPIFSNAWYSALLRDIFWPNFMYSGRFNTYSQFIWLFIISAVPGCCFGQKKKKHYTTTVILAILGVFLYLLLFETRARYLICFLPVFIMAAVLGIEVYYEWFGKLVAKWKKRHRIKDGNENEFLEESA